MRRRPAGARFAAARLEGVPIRDDVWAPLVAGLADEAEFVFVETAGGLFSPLSERFDALSLAKHLGADVLVVASDRLGSINHSRLTFTVLQQAGFSRGANSPSIVGFVFSEPAEPDESTRGNAAAFAESTDFPRVCSLSRQASWSAAAAALDPVLEWLKR